MNSKEARKAAIAEFKKKPVHHGVFAVKHTATGRLWIGSARNLEAVRNREFFALRQNLHQNKELQALWTQEGEAAFTFEVLETLDPELAEMLIADTLTAQRKYWIAKTGASSLLGF